MNLVGSADEFRKQILVGDVREQLKRLPDSSVHMVVTSPPYWLSCGLRDYGTASWEGGDEGCEHIPPTRARTDRPRQKLEGGTATIDAAEAVYRDVCGRCGAIRIDSQIGLEPTPELYVAHIVEVFREVRRVLRKDGTLWLNLGDSYGGGTGGDTRSGFNARYFGKEYASDKQGDTVQQLPKRAAIKPKDLVGIPWRVAFALQADGWWLRSDIIWSKPNPMPESVTDRPTKAHEYIFLMSKSQTYFYDAEAIKESAAESTLRIHQSAGVQPRAGEWKTEHVGNGHSGLTNGTTRDLSGRNTRTVWTIATEPYSEAHFATYATELVKRCIQAGSSEKGVCSECGAPWRRVVEKTASPHDGETASVYEQGSNGSRISLARQAARERGGEYAQTARTTGWQPTCKHEAPIAPAIILDPFMGSGTTGLVALRSGRDYVGVELNPAYVAMAEERLFMLKNQGRLV